MILRKLVRNCNLVTGIPILEKIFLNSFKSRNRQAPPSSATLIENWCREKGGGGHGEKYYTCHIYVKY